MSPNLSHICTHHIYSHKEGSSLFNVRIEVTSNPIPEIKLNHHKLKSNKTLHVDLSERLYPKKKNLGLRP